MSYDAAIWIVGTVAAAGSFLLAAYLLYQRVSRREARAELRREVDEADVDRLQRIKDALRLLAGPFPLSIALHLAAILFLIITLNWQHHTDLITVSLDAGNRVPDSSIPDFDVPADKLPDITPTDYTTEPPPTSLENTAVTSAERYVNSVNNGGIDIGPHSWGISGCCGNNHGHGFPGYILDLRRTGLDVMLVIDGTGSMKDVIGDVKAKMEQLVAVVHRLVPTARIGIIVYGGPNDSLQIQPLTRSNEKLSAFLTNVKAGGGGEWTENMLGANRAAIEQTDWKSYAKKVVVLVGDSPPAQADFKPLMELINKFKGMNGTFNTVDVTPEEHERFERELSIKLHGKAPEKISALPEFDKQTEAAFKMLAKTGGGAMRSLTGDVHINQQVLILVFGDKWEQEVARYGKDIAQSASK
ncbi:MAG TPA: vWA domain-containing protein [Candidatus Binataceae bacterium]|nr:vWA domain-containing protein [Candidatus Binataceae bacterium]